MTGSLTWDNFIPQQQNISIHFRHNIMLVERDYSLVEGCQQLHFPDVDVDEGCGIVLAPLIDLKDDCIMQGFS